jgi:hypothetical protein
MKKWILAILFCLCSSTAFAYMGATALTQSSLRIESKGYDVYRVGFIPDLTVNLGGIRVLPWNKHNSAFLLDMRAGITYVREPWILSLGAVTTMSTLPLTQIGLQAEVMEETSGLWLTSTISGDYTVRKFDALIMKVGMGWSLFGIELQKDITNNRQLFVIGVHLPFGLVAEELGTKRTGKLPDET